MCKTKMFMEMVLRMTRVRSKSVQKIGIAACIIRGRNAPLNKDFFQIQSIPTQTASLGSFPIALLCMIWTHTWLSALGDWMIVLRVR